MDFGFVRPPARWLLALGALGAFFALAFFVHDWMARERVAEGQGDKASVSIDRGVIDLGDKRAQRIGLKEEPAVAIQWAERVTAYGQVVPNPRASVEVRTVFAGKLREAPGSGSLALGRWVKAGQVLGQLEVRVGPQERLDWQAKLVEARGKKQQAEDVLKIHQEKLDRLKRVSTGEAVSRRELDEVMLQLAEARANLSTAKDVVILWEEALAESKEPAKENWIRPLLAISDGEVTELPARPGMAVEAGALVARLVDFRRPLVRLEIPPDVLTASAPESIVLYAATSLSPALSRISGPSGEAFAVPGMPATLVGPAAQVDAVSQLAAFWYEVKPEAAEPAGSVRRDGRAWRPGLPVKAQLPVVGGVPRDAVAVPSTALLYHQGYPLVYVRVGPGRYERREVQVLGRDGNRWVLARGVKPGEALVSEQAQTLLSEEFKRVGDND